MNDENYENKSEMNMELGERVVEEIGSIHKELAHIRELISRGHSLDRAIEEYRYLPPDVEDAFRWGFIGAWGNGRRACVHIHTDSKDKFFDDPDADPEHVAALAAVFSSPNTIRVCLYLFHHRKTDREELEKELNLSSEELDEAVKPLLDWRFVVWKEGKLSHQESELNKQGVNYAVTLLAMTKTAFGYKDRQVHK